MEVWKKIKEFDNYEVSNYGRIKSLPRQLKNRGGLYFSKEKILTSNVGFGGYKFQKIKDKNFSIHRLVAEYFLHNEENKKIVNHKDLNILNNHVDNLEWVTSRENAHHYELSQKRISKYIGVTYDKRRDKWVAKIKINGKTVNIARSNNEIEAYNKFIEYAKSKGISSKYF